MSNLISGGATLTVSRLSNFGILFLSPLLLVRILNVDAYGQYQEFMIYATFLITVCEFGIPSSLTYFVPRYPERETIFVAKTSLITLIMSALWVAVLLLARPAVVEITSYDFVLPLAAYTFCFVNFNWLEYYWIAKRRADLVLYYSAARLLIRVGVLLVVAYLTRDVQKILWSIIAVELLRLLLVAGFVYRAQLLKSLWSAEGIKEQLRFATPIGMAQLAQYVARDLAKFFIGGVLGPAALAYYAVATYLLPVVHLVRMSVSDAVFPELVRRSSDRTAAVQLWKRAHIVVCALLFPLFVILAYHAELVVTTLFTEAYLPAVPVFCIYLFWLLRRCFNLDVLLRTAGKTGFVLTGTVFSLAINLVLMVFLYQQFGFVGPAIAFIVSEILLELYYATRVKQQFQLSVASMVDWRGVGRIGLGCMAGFVLLFAADSLPVPELVGAGLGAIAFVSVCWFVAYRLGIDDIGRVAHFALSSIRKRTRLLA